jgi:SagB-type dehydrogenase family enzyme
MLQDIYQRMSFYRKLGLCQIHSRSIALVILKSILFAIFSITWLSACNFTDRIAEVDMVSQASLTQTREDGAQASQIIRLPTPSAKGTISLDEAMAKRRSVREFSDIPLTEAELGQLLWAAQGITHPEGYRTAPSAGGLYPLEVHAITSAGLYHYQPSEHTLQLVREGDLRPALHAVALKQDAVLKAPVVILITAVFERTEVKYGKDRSPRYIQMEVGHAAQNLLLQAVALDLGAVVVGAFLDESVKATLSLPDDHQPLYLIPVGHPE